MYACVYTYVYACMRIAQWLLKLVYSVCDVAARFVYMMVYVRYLILSLYQEYGTTMLVVIETTTVP